MSGVLAELEQLANDFRRSADAATERGKRHLSYNDTQGWDRCEGKADAFSSCAAQVDKLGFSLSAALRKTKAEGIEVANDG